MSWTTIISAGIDTAMSIKKEMETAKFRSRVLNDLTEIKKHLKEINQKLDNVIEGNKQILERLDLLPSKIYKLTDKVVADHLLSERYVNMRSQLTLFTAIEDRDDWDLSQEGWLSFNEDLHYIFLKENRISYLLRLIPISELSISIYGKFGEAVISVLVPEKLEKLNTLLGRLEDKIIEKLDNLKSLLDNKKYITNHNLTDGLSDFNNLEFQKVGHKTKIHYYNVKECHQEYDNTCCRYREVCKNVRKSKVISDSAFNEGHDNHILRIDNLIIKLKSLLVDFSDTNQVKEVLSSYDSHLKEKNENDSNTNEIKLVSYGADELIEKADVKITSMIRKNRNCY